MSSIVETKLLADRAAILARLEKNPVILRYSDLLDEVILKTFLDIFRSGCINFTLILNVALYDVEERNKIAIALKKLGLFSFTLISEPSQEDCKQAIRTTEKQCEVFRQKSGYN